MMTILTTQLAFYLVKSGQQKVLNALVRRQDIAFLKKAVADIWQQEQPGTEQHNLTSALCETLSSLYEPFPEKSILLPLLEEALKAALKKSLAGLHEMVKARYEEHGLAPSFVRQQIADIMHASQLRLEQYAKEIYDNLNLVLDDSSNPVTKSALLEIYQSKCQDLEESWRLSFVLRNDITSAFQTAQQETEEALIALLQKTLDVSFGENPSLILTQAKKCLSLLQDIYAGNISAFPQLLKELRKSAEEEHRTLAELFLDRARWRGLREILEKAQTMEQATNVVYLAGRTCLLHLLKMEYQLVEEDLQKLVTLDVLENTRRPVEEFLARLMAVNDDRAAFFTETVRCELVGLILPYCPAALRSSLLTILQEEINTWSSDNKFLKKILRELALSFMLDLFTVDIDITNEYNETLSILAYRCGHTSMAQQFILWGVNPDVVAISVTPEQHTVPQSSASASEIIHVENPCNTLWRLGMRDASQLLLSLLAIRQQFHQLSNADPCEYSKWFSCYQAMRALVQYGLNIQPTEFCNNSRAVSHWSQVVLQPYWSWLDQKLSFRCRIGGVAPAPVVKLLEAAKTIEKMADKATHVLGHDVELASSLVEALYKCEILQNHLMDLCGENLRSQLLLARLVRYLIELHQRLAKTLEEYHQPDKARRFALPSKDLQERIELNLDSRPQKDFPRRRKDIFYRDVVIVFAKKFKETSDKLARVEAEAAETKLALLKTQETAQEDKRKLMETQETQQQELRETQKSLAQTQQAAKKREDSLQDQINDLKAQFVKFMQKQATGEHSSLPASSSHASSPRFFGS